MIKDVASNFFYNKNPYPVTTRARKKPEPAPQPLTKNEINTTNTMASAHSKLKTTETTSIRIYASYARSLEFRAKACGANANYANYTNGIRI